jgi:hypothetical protein
VRDEVKTIHLLGLVSLRTQITNVEQGSNFIAAYIRQYSSLLMINIYLTKPPCWGGGGSVVPSSLGRNFFENLVTICGCRIFVQ